MRRKDREITDVQEIYRIFGTAEYGTLSLCDNGKPYAIPISCCFYLDEGGMPTIAWHGASEGRKVEILRQNPSVVYSCVSECRRDMKPEEKYWSLFYRSAIGSGQACEVLERAEKLEILHRILRHYGENGVFEFPAALLDRMGIWKCRLEEVTGKAHEE